MSINPVHANYINIPNVADADKLLIVDCLLPGTIRQLGSRLTTLTARRAVKTSGVDCERRGGEYIPADRANTASALKVWQPMAEAGDVQAQTYVGEIYEKGMGTAPNYPQAVHWYTQAANRGDPRAKTNLGYLSERGLGVARNPAQATVLYSDASRLGGNYSTAEPAAAPPARQAPAATVQKKEADLREKQKRIRETENKLAEEERAQASSKDKVAVPPTTTADAPTGKADVSGVSFGKYYAVVIGNQDYTDYNDLNTSVNDAQAVAATLEGRYGFRTVVLSNATRSKMLAAFDALRDKLGPQDNLLIYYAGHGELTGGSGYWLPVDARKGDTKSWVSNAQITNFVDAMQAKHVLVVADSCYSGTLSQASIPRNAGGAKSREWYATVAKTKVRVVLSSGGVRPVLDSGGGKHSVFAAAFLNALNAGGAVLEGAKVFRRLRGQVSSAAGATGTRQAPQFAPIRFAGHEAGDFVFLKDGLAVIDGEPQDPDDPRLARVELLAILEKSLLSVREVEAV